MLIKKGRVVVIAQKAADRRIAPELTPEQEEIMKPIREALRREMWEIHESQVRIPIATITPQWW